MPLYHLILLLCLVAIWGVNFVAVKMGLKEIPPIFLCFSRFFLASIPWVFFVKRPNVSIKMVLLYGWVMFALQFSLMFLGIFAGVTAGLASILIQFQVFFSILLAMIFLNERIEKWQAIGALVAFSGVILIGLNVGGEVTSLGLLLVLLAAAFWGAGSVISKKMGNINMFSLVVWGSLVAWPPLLLASYLFEGEKVAASFKSLSWLGAASILYIVYFSTLFGFGVWNWLLRTHSISKVAPFTLLVPFFGTLSSIFILKEPLQPWKMGAGFLVIAGLCIHLLGPRFSRKFKELSREKEEIS